jgi:hypothetical protein
MSARPIAHRGRTCQGSPSSFCPQECDAFSVPHAGAMLGRWEEGWTIALQQGTYSSTRAVLEYYLVCTLNNCAKKSRNKAQLGRFLHDVHIGRVHTHEKSSGYVTYPSGRTHWRRRMPPTLNRTVASTHSLTHGCAHSLRGARRLASLGRPVASMHAKPALTTGVARACDRRVPLSLLLLTRRTFKHMLARHAAPSVLPTTHVQHTSDQHVRGAASVARTHTHARTHLHSTHSHTHTPAHHSLAHTHLTHTHLHITRSHTHTHTCTKTH